MYVLQCVDEDIGVCTAVYGNAVAEGVETQA